MVTDSARGALRITLATLELTWAPEAGTITKAKKKAESTIHDILEKRIPPPKV
jgi:hypothetical protein